MGWWRVECDAQPDLDVPAGHADIFDEQAQQLLFLGVIEGVDDGVDPGGEVVHAGSELIVAGKGGAFVGEAVRLCCRSFRRAAISVARRCISGSSMNPPW